jgi:hypothetical protein
MSMVTTPAAFAAAPNHPRLLFDARDVPALRARLAGPLKPVAQALRAAVEAPYQPNSDFARTPDVTNKLFRGDIRGMADTVASYAFASLMFRDGGADRIFPELTHLERADLAAHAEELGRNYLLGICDPSFPNWLFQEYQEGTTPDLPMAHFLFDVALAYDWLYPTLSEAERERCRQRVAREAPKMYQAAQNPDTWWLHEYTQNHFWLNHAGLGMAALAFDGEIPDTEKWRTTAAAAMQTVRTVTDAVVGGAWHEGIGYGNYGMLSLLPFSLANQRLKGGPDYADSRFVRDYPAFRMYGMPGAKAHRREFLVYSDFSNFQNDDTLAVVRYAARKWRDGHAAWYADAFTDGMRQGRGGLTSWPPGQRGIILSAILYDDRVKPVPPPNRGAAWDLDFYAADLSMMLARSGWNEGDSLLAFKSGVFGGHAAFERLRKRTLPHENLNFGHNHADDMGVYFFAEGEWLTTTVPAYYIGRGNNPVSNLTSYANSLLVDGKGQILEGTRSGSALHSPGFFDRISSIPLRGSTAHYAFSLGEGSRLYEAKLGLKTFDRAILFVERRIPLVRDVVRGTVSHRYEIGYHAIDDATRDGDWLRLAAKNDRLLGVRVLAPANFAFRTENQKAANLQSFDPDGAMTGAFIAPPADGPSATFLTALAPTRTDTWAAKPKIDPIDAVTPDRGATITNTGVAGERIDVVFADAPTESVSAGGLAVTGIAGAVNRQNGRVARVMLAGGTRLAWEGQPRIEILGDSPASLEVEYKENGSVAISGETDGARVYAPGASSVTYNAARIAFQRDGDYIVIRPKRGTR